MAMIKCRECGKEISSRAEFCPNCGAKTRFGEEESERKQMSSTAVVYAVLSIIGTIVFFYGLFTMIGDIDAYHDVWARGYNYELPWTAHEVQVILTMLAGLALDFGAWAGFRKMKKGG